jgi:hypothetical protein
MQMTRLVLLHDERQLLLAPGADLAAGLGRDAEIALGPVGLESHGEPRAPPASS